MCGIIAVLNRKSEPVVPLLVESLKRLEYRGYDSAGLAFVNDNHGTTRIRTVGRVATLEEAACHISYQEATVGIGHTRWATHGVVAENNAHPQKTGCVSIVHNGIIENYAELKGLVQNKFESETDSEIISSLIAMFLANNMSFQASFEKMKKMLKGSYAIVAMCEKEPDTLIGAKSGAPMAIGYNDRQIYIASDAIALAGISSKVVYLDEGDMVVCKDNKYTIYDSCLNMTSRAETNSYISTTDVTKCGYEDYMLKEISEEPDVFVNTFANFDCSIDIKKYKSLVLVACGTSYYAGMLAKYWIEDMVGMQVNVEIASEFRYRHPFMSRDSLFVFISQSGETIDTLCAMRNILAERLSAISIVNVPGSSIAREATYTIYTHAGVEIGVASTKAFISQALTLLLLAVPKGNICSDKIAKAMFSIIQRQSEFEEVAKSIVNSRAIMCIGRGTSYPIALECALKMKEITYICSEGHPAGEIKHGPMALIDKNVCTIVLTPQDRYREKTLSNAQEIMARNGQILTIGSNKIDVCPAIVIENISEIGNPFVCATAIHLLAYHTAKAKGVDVDKPRNLAKSVTVE